MSDLELVMVISGWDFFARARRHVEVNRNPSSLQFDYSAKLDSTVSRTTHEIKSAMDSSIEYVLLPGADRLNDRIVQRDLVRLTLIPQHESPTGSTCVQAQIEDGPQESLPFVLAIARVPEASLEDFGRSRGFHVTGTDAPISRHDPLDRSSSASYIATADNCIHCIRTTAHQGKIIGYAQKHPLMIGSAPKTTSRPTTRA